MANLDLKLFSKLAFDILNRNIINKNRDGKIDEITSSDLLRDYGQLLIYNEKIFGTLLYDFKESNASNVSTFIIEGIEDNTNILEMINLINKNFFNLKYQDSVQDINYYINNIDCFFDDEILNKSGIAVIKDPFLEKEITKEIPFSDNDSITDPIYKYSEQSKFNLGVLISLINNNQVQSKRVRDFYSVIENIKNIHFKNLNIDDNFIEIINNKFKNAEITISNCSLNSSSFYKLGKRKIIFKNMDINLDNLNNSECDYEFYRCNIYNTKFIKINGLKMNFEECNINFHQLSLISNFEKVEYLNIESRTDTNINDLVINFLNIKKIVIKGKIVNLESLTRFQNLDNYIIGDMEDDFEDYYCKLSEIEKQKIISNNSKEILIEKIKKQKSYLNDYELNEIEKARIIKLSKLYNSLILDNNRLDTLKKYNTFEQYIKSSDFPIINDGQYIYNGKLYFDRNILKNNSCLSISKIFDIYEDYLVKHNEFENENEIYEGIGRLIYNSDGRPIVISNFRTNYIDSIEKAKEDASKNLVHNRLISDIYADAIIEYIFTNIPDKPIKMTEWLFGMSEVVGFALNNDKETYDKVIEILKDNYGDNLSLFYAKLDNYLEEKNISTINRNKNIIIKNELLNEMLLVILNNYDSLSNDETLYLYDILMKDNRSFHSISLIKAAAKKYNIEINDDIILSELSIKCNYDFEKKLKDFNTPFFDEDNNLYGMMIEKEVIDELKNNKAKVKKR